MKKKQGAFNNSNNLTTDKDSKKNINTSKNVNLE